MSIAPWIVDFSRRGNIRESAVAVISEKRAWRGTIDEVKIEVTIVIIIEECTTGTEGLRQVKLTRCPVGMCKADTGTIGDICEMERGFCG